MQCRRNDNGWPDPAFPWEPSGSRIEEGRGRGRGTEDRGPGGGRGTTCGLTAIPRPEDRTIKEAGLLKRAPERPQSSRQALPVPQEEKLAEGTRPREVTECTHTRLDGMASCTPRLDGMAPPCTRSANGPSVIMMHVTVCVNSACGHPPGEWTWYRGCTGR